MLRRILTYNPLNCVDFDSGSFERIRFGAASIQGWRRNFEDRFVIEPAFHGDLSFFGVFDGHGGSVVAEFLKRNLSIQVKYLLTNGEDIELALYLGFLNCDFDLQQPASIQELRDIWFKNPDVDEFESDFANLLSEEEAEEGEENLVQQQQQQQQAAVVQEEEEECPHHHAYTCGSTGTAVVIDGNRIYIANVGNTRCVLSRGRQAVRLSVDHTPSNAEEYSRITAAGATVSETGLINNSLSVSRAFGNFQYKSSDLPTSILSAEPYVRTIDIQPDDEFLVIASNGVWNCFHDYEVVEFVHRKLERNRELHGYCHDMCEHLIYRTRYMEGVGTGNLTVMIIQLNVNADH